MTEQEKNIFNSCVKAECGACMCFHVLLCVFLGPISVCVCVCMCVVISMYVCVCFHVASMWIWGEGEGSTYAIFSRDKWSNILFSLQFSENCQIFSVAHIVSFFFFLFQILMICRQTVQETQPMFMTEKQQISYLNMKDFNAVCGGSAVMPCLGLGGLSNISSGTAVCQKSAGVTSLVSPDVWRSMVVHEN